MLLPWEWSYQGPQSHRLGGTAKPSWGTECDYWQFVQKNVYCIFLFLELDSFKLVLLHRLLLLRLDRPISLIQLYTINPTALVFEYNSPTSCPDVSQSCLPVQLYTRNMQSNLGALASSSVISVHQIPALLCVHVSVFLSFSHHLQSGQVPRVTLDTAAMLIHMPIWAYPTNIHRASALCYDHFRIQIQQNSLKDWNNAV